MSTKHSSRSIEVDLAKIDKLNVASLRAMYARVFNRETHSRDKRHLRKRIVRRLEILAKKRPAKHPAHRGHRDVRLPAPGTLLRRMHKGVRHEVTVLDDGFAYDGETYGSLSTVAKVITGTTWNGFGFFRRALIEAEV